MFALVFCSIFLFQISCSRLLVNFCSKLLVDIFAQDFCSRFLLIIIAQTLCSRLLQEFCQNIWPRFLLKIVGQDFAQDLWSKLLLKIFVRLLVPYYCLRLLLNFLFKIFAEFLLEVVAQDFGSRLLQESCSRFCPPCTLTPNPWRAFERVFSLTHQGMERLLNASPYMYPEGFNSAWGLVPAAPEREVFTCMTSGQSL